MAEREAPKERSSSLLPRWTPSIPTSFINILNPFAGDAATKPDSDAPESAANKRTSFISSFWVPAAPSQASSQRDDESIMFAEPDTRSNSEGGSRHGSVDGGDTRKAKKCNKTKTCYSICHPPPASTTRQKMHRRPRSLLQLHRLCPDARPKPAVEVIPSANYSVRLRRAVTKVFPARHGRCPNDLVVLRAEKYSADEPDEEQEARDIIALICKGRKEEAQTASKARICFADGREWEAYPTLSGGYELFATDEHGLGLTVRWVPKKGREVSKKKFNFSTISPNSRRHPVIASLDRTRLDINDSFKIPGAQAATPLSTPRQGSSLLTDTMAEEAEETDQCQTDDRLRDLILVSSIWVAFKEGWSPTLKCDDRERDAPPFPRSPSLQASPSKEGGSTFSLPTTAPPSPGPASPGFEKRLSIASASSGGLLSKSNLLGKSNGHSTHDADMPPPPSPAQSPVRSGRTRADSTSTVLVHRAASNRVRNSANVRQETLAPQAEAQEPALSDDELARSQFDGPIPTERRDSYARPILPPATDSDRSINEADATASTSRSRRRESPQTGKRESSATSYGTTSTGDVSKRSPAPVKKKKMAGLRRLLCGNS